MTTNEPISGDELDDIMIRACALAFVTPHDYARWRRNDDGTIDYIFEIIRPGDNKYYAVTISHEFIQAQDRQNIINYIARKMT